MRVGVIGAGVAGLVTAKVLKQDGFEVSIFEKEPGVGGVWAASRAYPGLRANNPREAFIGAYVAHYIDRLMRDMGLPARRTDSLAEEYLGPLWARRYRGVAAERGQKRAAGQVLS